MKWESGKVYKEKVPLNRGLERGRRWELLPEVKAGRRGAKPELGKGSRCSRNVQKDV